jgi:hypothetical protein
MAGSVADRPGSKPGRFCGRRVCIISTPRLQTTNVRPTSVKLDASAASYRQNPKLESGLHPVLQPENPPNATHAIAATTITSMVMPHIDRSPKRGF